MLGRNGGTVNGGPSTLAVVVQALMAVVLVLVGTWGRQAADTLAPLHLSQEEREQRAAVMRRGSVACIVVGAVLALSVLWVVAS